MAGRRKKRRCFTAERREAYLEGLRRTGNYLAAAREAEITDGGARRYRRRRPEFEAECIEAEAEAQRRLAGAQGPFDGTREGAFESIRRGADGRLKIQAQGRRRWSRKKEERFFAVLRECGNVAASARCVGVSREAIWKRRREWPAFARRFEETLDEAEVALEFRVACQGTNWTEATQEAGEGGEPEERMGTRTFSGKSTCPPPCPSPVPVPFDAELAIRFLKWRAEKKAGRKGPAAALPSAEEVRERILRKVAAIRRHREREAARREEEEGEA